MRADTSLFRFSAGLAVAGLLLGPLSTTPAAAQPAPPPQAGDAASLADPPARVGRLARLSGTVSFRPTSTDPWNAATPNYPVTSGNCVWTEPQAGADIEIGASRLALDGATEFDIDRLDDAELAATLGQGLAYLHLRDPAPDSVVTLRTPRGTVTIGQAGRYLIAAGDAATPTRVTAVDGAAQIDGAGVSLAVGPGQTATISGSDHFEGSVGPLVQEPFLSGQLARERPAAVSQGAAPPPVVLQMTGAQPLLETGEWDNVPEYGRVWYPPVARDWVPYRSGHWAWVSPWGWTWVDQAPWGFAPFHYGRWVEHGDRWGWVPADAAIEVSGPPVYAPALVSWVDVAAGAAIGVAAGLAIGAAVGWIPLGPREPFRPWYHSSPGYFGRVNSLHVTNVTNITNVNNVTNINNFVNRGAGSFGSPGSVAGGPRQGGHWQGMTPQMVAASRPVSAVPVRPSLATPGVTQAVARQLQLPPGPAASARPTFAPGPATPSGPGGRPLLRPAGPIVPAAAVPGAAGPHIGAAAVPGAAAPHFGPAAVPGAAAPHFGPAGAAATAQPGLPALSQPGNGHPFTGRPEARSVTNHAAPPPSGPAGSHTAGPGAAAASAATFAPVPAAATHPAASPPTPGPESHRTEYRSSVQRATVPQSYSPPAHSAPPTPMHAAPSFQPETRYSSPPPQHAAPSFQSAPRSPSPPPPPPHQGGSEHKSCPPNHPNC
jgi:hypothetical protein